MVDLEDDGRQEALVFLRRSTDEKPLKIMVYRLDENDSYCLFCTVESSGTVVDSVYYQDLDGDGRRELIVGWRISADVQTLAAYSMEPEPRWPLCPAATAASAFRISTAMACPACWCSGPTARWAPWRSFTAGRTSRWAYPTAAACPAP